MIRDTIAKIEQKLQQSESLTPETRQELMQLLARLKAEAMELSKTDAERAADIVGHTEVVTSEAIGEERNPERIKSALEELSESVDGFEKSHPRLVEIVNRIATTLASLGI